jgi:hypothetical protein
MKKAKPLINQKGKDYLTYGEINAILPFKTVFPERSVTG